MDYTHPILISFVYPLLMGFAHGFQRDPRSWQKVLWLGFTLLAICKIINQIASTRMHVEIIDLPIGYMYIFMVPYYLIGLGTLYYLRATPNTSHNKKSKNLTIKPISLGSIVCPKCDYTEIIDKNKLHLTSSYREYNVRPSRYFTSMVYVCLRCGNKFRR